jgi:hypothetical protein
VQPPKPEAGARDRAKSSGAARENSSAAEDRADARAQGTEDAGARPREPVSRGWWRAAVTLAVLGAVWWPARPGGVDGFPLSSYPMFGYAREPTSVVDTVLGVRADGRRQPLSPERLAGVRQPKLALERVREAIGRKRAGALCRDVARRVLELPAEERPVALEVVTETWGTLEGLEPGAKPRKRVVHERCEVGG